MKIFKATVAFLLVAVLTATPQAFFFGHSPASTGGGGGGLATPDLMAQNFDSGSSSTPSGWFVEGGTPKWNYSPGLGGTPYALAIRGPSADVVSSDFGGTSGANEFWAHFLFYATNMANANMVIFYNTNKTLATMVLATSGGKLYLQDYWGNYTLSTGAMTSNTLYYVWMHYKKGTSGSSNAVVSAAFNTTATIPTFTEGTSGANYTSFTNAFGTNATRYIYLKTEGNPQMNVYDHLGLATFSMPNGW